MGWNKCRHGWMGDVQDVKNQERPETERKFLDRLLFDDFRYHWSRSSNMDTGYVVRKRRPYLSVEKKRVTFHFTGWLMTGSLYLQ